MKKIIPIFLSLALLCAASLPAFAADKQTDTAAASSYTIRIDGKDSGVTPCVMVPLRAVAEKLGFKVTWQNGSVLVDDGEMHTVVTIGVDSYTVVTSIPGAVGMSAPFSLGAAPYLSNGTTYVPLELFRPLLGNGDDVITVSGGVISITSGKSSGVQIPNPFVSCADMAEAAKVAGFTFTVPDSLAGYNGRWINAIAGDLIQVVYGPEDNEVRLRKGTLGDVSGDYNEYAETAAVPVGSVSVTMKGADGKVSTAIWSANGYSYSATFDVPVSRDAVISIVNVVK